MKLDEEDEFQVDRQEDDRLVQEIDAAYQCSWKDYEARKLKLVWKPCDPKNESDAPTTPVEDG